MLPSKLIPGIIFLCFADMRWQQELQWFHLGEWTFSLKTADFLGNLLSPEDCGLQHHPLIEASSNYHSRIYLPSSWKARLTKSRCHLYFIGLQWLPFQVWFYWKVLIQAWNILAAWETLHLAGKCELKAVDITENWRMQGVYYTVPNLVKVIQGQSFTSQELFFFPLHFSWTSVILCFLRGSTLCNVVHRQHYVILLWKLAFWMLCGFWIVITEVICFYENSLIEILCQFWHFLIVLCVSELSL